MRSVRQLNRRRAVVALARWRTGDALTNLRVTDVTGTSTIIDPASVDWAGFPPPSSELGG